MNILVYIGNGFILIFALVAMFALIRNSRLAGIIAIIIGLIGFWLLILGVILTFLF